jgi:hypothetical protein
VESAPVVQMVVKVGNHPKHHHPRPSEQGAETDRIALFNHFLHSHKLQQLIVVIQFTGHILVFRASRRAELPRVTIHLNTKSSN